MIFSGMGVAHVKIIFQLKSLRRRAFGEIALRAQKLDFLKQVKRWFDCRHCWPDLMLVMSGRDG